MKTVGNLLSDAALYADSAVRLFIASTICIDEARALAEHERSVGGTEHIDGHRDDADGLYDIVDAAAVFLEQLVGFADYIQLLADDYGHREVSRRFYGRREQS